VQGADLAGPDSLGGILAVSLAIPVPTTDAENALRHDDFAAR
jgi:hypothetical protein